MSVSAVHGSSHFLPVQPTPPVKPVKAKAEPVEEPHEKPRPKPPPGQGAKFDIRA